jgi:rod shape-determining protein MreD
VSEQAGKRPGITRGSFANLYLVLAILALAVLIQGTLLARIHLLGAHPNLVLVMVVSWSLLEDASTAMFWGFIGGLGLDLIAGLPLGTTSLALILICPLAGLGTQSIFAGNLLLPIFTVALATPLHGGIILLIQQLLGRPVDWIASVTGVIGPEIALNCLFVLLVYPLLRRFAAQIGALAWK